MKQTLWGQAANITHLEQLAEGSTGLHRLHPGVKLTGTLCYLVCLVSLGPYDFLRLSPFLFYPLIATALGEFPLGLLLRRTLAALPFSLFAGIGSLIFDRNVVYSLGGLPVTGGMIAFGSILIRTVFVVWAVLLLMAVTPLSDLTMQLRRLHLPEVLVRLFEMTYRYAGTLLEEAGRMGVAYALRSGGKNALEMRHMGAFVGGLLLKSHARAQRVYQAMCLRGYGRRLAGETPHRLCRNDMMYGILVIGSTLCFRLMDIPELLGRLALCWM